MLELPVRVVHVWTIELDRLSVVELEPILSPEEAERAQRHRFEVHRARRIAARAALRILLGRYLGERPAAIRLGATARGKPTLLGSQRWLEFNLAHSEGCALAAFAGGRPVGVDLERIDSQRVDEPLLEAVLTPDERAALESYGSRKRVHRFFELWVMKEAWAKCDGTGFAREPDTFQLTGPNAERPWIAEDVTPLPGFASALAVATPAEPIVEVYSFELDAEMGPGMAASPST